MCHLLRECLKIVVLYAGIAWSLCRVTSRTVSVYKHWLQVSSVELPVDRLAQQPEPSDGPQVRRDVDVVSLGSHRGLSGHAIAGQCKVAACGLRRAAPLCRHSRGACGHGERCLCQSFPHFECGELNKAIMCCS